MCEQPEGLWRGLRGKPDPSSVETAGEEEGRVWVRFPADLEARVVAPNRTDEPGLSARIRNISRGGARLLVARPFDPGSMLTVVLASSHGKTSLAVLACVVRCDGAGGNEWRVGCSFSTELDDDDLSCFGAVKARPLGPDGRNWTRFPCDVTATVQRLSDDDPKRYSARVRDISASGVALI